MEILKKIIRSARMSTSPEFYSGRGATLMDLNSGILEMIYQGINNEYGEEAANNYVKMVDGIKVMSATTFLNELYNLKNCGWKYVSTEDNLPDITTLYESLNLRFDDTQKIKNRFLIKHDIQPKTIYNSFNNITYYHF